MLHMIYSAWYLHVLERENNLVKNNEPSEMISCRLPSQAWERKLQHAWSKSSVLPYTCISSVLPYTCISSRGYGHVVLDAHFRMYWNHFMHVHARIEGLRVYARIPSLSYLCTCLLVSRGQCTLYLLAMSVHLPWLNCI